MAGSAPGPRFPWANTIGSLLGGKRLGPVLGLRIAGLAIAANALMSTIIWPPRPLLVWNGSQSSPAGLYLITAPDNVGAGDFVLAWAPDWARKLGAERRYIPLNVPLVKQVAAVSGEQICLRHQSVFIGTVLVGLRRHADPAGRVMPRPEGCAKLRTGELFLFSSGQRLAFDGRYFGVTEQREVIGKAQLIWRA